MSRFYGMCGVVVALVAAAAPPSRADSYEGFGYGSGQNLNGQNGGSGWGGAWNEPANDPTNTQPDKVWSDGLGFPGLATTGGKMVGEGQYNFAGRATTSGSGAAGTSTFLSFLIRHDSTGDGAGFPASDPDYGGLEIGSTQRLFVGSLASGKLGADNASTGVGAAASNVSDAIGSTSFIVAQIDWQSGNDTVSLFINRDPSGLLGSPDVVKNDLDLGDLGDLGISTGVNGKWSVDEIRILNAKILSGGGGGGGAQEAFAAVAPAIPLPSALLAFPAVAALAGYCSRRFKRMA